jgi:hypothetical protein
MKEKKKQEKEIKKKKETRNKKWNRNKKNRKKEKKVEKENHSGPRPQAASATASDSVAEATYNIQQFTVPRSLAPL